MYLLKRNWYVAKIITAVDGGAAADAGHERHFAAEKKSTFGSRFSILISLPKIGSWNRELELGVFWVVENNITIILFDFLETPMKTNI